MNKEKKVVRILAYCGKEKVDTYKQAIVNNEQINGVLKLQPRTKLFTRLHLHFNYF